MKVLSIRAPWAWAILEGHKRVENRTWQVKHRGPLAIHAGGSKRSDKQAAELFASLGLVCPFDMLQRGAIIGLVDLVDIVDTYQDDPFAEGPFYWLLENPRWFDEPVRCDGQLGLWEYDIKQGAEV